ncbi:MAG: hypothetical protein WCD61_01245, partial [Acinetobacter bohemicus]
LIDLPEVLFNITADGCAFYSISHPIQPLFQSIFNEWLFIALKSFFWLFNIHFYHYFYTPFLVKLILTTYRTLKSLQNALTKTKNYPTFTCVVIHKPKLCSSSSK